MGRSPVPHLKDLFFQKVHHTLSENSNFYRSEFESVQMETSMLPICLFECPKFPRKLITVSFRMFYPTVYYMPLIFWALKKQIQVIVIEFSRWIEKYLWLWFMNFTAEIQKTRNHYLELLRQIISFFFISQLFL